MSVKNVRHIAIAVRDLEAARDSWAKLLDAKPSEINEVSDQQVRVCFFQLGLVKIELISPTADNKAINRFLDKHGEGLHHICLGVKSLQGTLDAYYDADVKLIDRIPRTGAEGHKIAFVHPKATTGVLVELEEPEEEPS